MAEELPITTATAKVRIEPDRTEWDRFIKEDAPGDIDTLRVKLAEALKIDPESLKRAFREASEAVKSEESRRENDSETRQTNQNDGVVEQGLGKLTQIIDLLERILKVQEDIEELLRNQQSR